MIAPNESFGGRPSAEIPLSEEERQALLLALARLSIERPGWLSLLEGLAAKFGGAKLLHNFRVSAGSGHVTDTSNCFEVVRVGANEIKVAHWEQVAGKNCFTLQGAVILAAWLAVLADPELKEFQRVVSEIKR
jgi:hypothetical protein